MENLGHFRRFARGILQEFESAFLQCASTLTCQLDEKGRLVVCRPTQRAKSLGKQTQTLDEAQQRGTTTCFASGFVFYRMGVDGCKRREQGVRQCRLVLYYITYTVSLD